METSVKRPTAEELDELCRRAEHHEKFRVLEVGKCPNWEDAELMPFYNPHEGTYTYSILNFEHASFGNEDIPENRLRTAIEQMFASGYIVEPFAHSLPRRGDKEAEAKFYSKV